MRFPVLRLQRIGLGLLLAGTSATGQLSPAKPALPAVSNLRLPARNAGYIFYGTVLSVEAVAESEAESVPTVKITFRVEQAIRGTRAGRVLTIREWAGVWDSGEHYRPGERLLLFLYGPSKLGLTSAVGGPSGRFAVDSSGNVLLENGSLPALALDAVTRSQLRAKNRVNARVLARAIERADTE